MVGKKRKYKYGKEYKRRRVPSDQEAVICYCPKVCPDVMRVRLRYNAVKDLSGGGLSGFNAIVFRGNSIFDPDFSGGGHQPLGHDQWANFYRRYRVLGSKIIVRAASDSAAPAGIGVVPQNTNTVLSQRTEYAEASYVKNVPLGADASHAIAMIENYVSTAKMRGGPPNYVRLNEDLSALVGANPAQQFYWHVFGYSLDATVNWVIKLEVEVQYYVEFYDRETLAQS